jgi:excinuclease ABC subunit C
MNVKAYLAALPNRPGVYRMLNDRGDVLYVGKAKNLKRRVTNYTQANRLIKRHQRMVAETRHLEVITTETEIKALLLEINLIKSLRPRYNILLRDDKSFPYLFLTGDHEFPQVMKHRGTRRRPGDYFGPFASSFIVDRTMVGLQRAFQLRNCPDTIFANRTRPCLQYHIKRCSAPCVGKITPKQNGKVYEIRRMNISLSLLQIRII